MEEPGPQEADSKQSESPTAEAALNPRAEGAHGALDPEVLVGWDMERMVSQDSWVRGKAHALLERAAKTQGPAHAGFCPPFCLRFFARTAYPWTPLAEGKQRTRKS